MNGRALAEVAFRVWGTVLFLDALASLPGTLLVATASSSAEPGAALLRTTQIAALLTLILQALLGGGLVLAARRIAQMVVPVGTPLALAMDAFQLQCLGFALVGVVLLISGLQKAAVTTYTLLSRPDSESPLSFVWTSERQTVIGSVVEVVAGLLLIFGRSGIAKGWSHLRGASTPDAG